MARLCAAALLLAVAACSLLATAQGREITDVPFNFSADPLTSSCRLDWVVLLCMKRRRAAPLGGAACAAPLQPAWSSRHALPHSWDTCETFCRWQPAAMRIFWSAFAWRVVLRGAFITVLCAASSRPLARAARS